MLKYFFIKGEINMESIFDEAINADLPRRRRINIPESVRFGLEIENNGLENIKRIHEADRLIYNLDPNLQVKDDRSLSIITKSKTIEYGFEVVTPVLNSKKSNIELLIKLSNTLKHINPKYNLSSFQINLDDNLTDSERLYLLKLYTYFEPVIARFCRGKDPVLRPQVNTYADFIYFRMINSINLFDHPHDIVETFSNNKMLAVNFKNKPIKLIEFRLPNGTNEYTLWFNYINAFSNLLNAVEKHKMDEEYLDYVLKRNREHINSNYNYQYKCFPIKKELAEEFANLIFNHDKDKLYFLQQYIGSDINIKKAL